MTFKKLNSSVLTLLLVWQNESTVGDTVRGTRQPSTWMAGLQIAAPSPRVWRRSSHGGERCRRRPGGWGSGMPGDYLLPSNQTADTGLDGNWAQKQGGEAVKGLPWAKHKPVPRDHWPFHPLATLWNPVIDLVLQLREARLPAQGHTAS